jgi:4-phytase / acid phosphatase
MRVTLAATLLLTVAIPPGLAMPPAKPKDHLRFTLILSRHGVRAPLTVATVYSAQPWPEWEVPAGRLTPHGAQALRQMGAYMREDFADHGLFPTAGCLAPAEIYLYSDTDERNISSTRATFDSFAPGCVSFPIQTVDPAILDPLFRTSGLFPPLPDGTKARRVALLAESPNVFSHESHAQLDFLSHILSPDPAHRAEKSIFGPYDGISVDPGDVIAASRPRSVASEIVEDLLLEYVDGKPIAQVGWGRVDEASLRRLIPIRIGAFNLDKRTVFFARTASSNMLDHLLETLAQAASNVATPGALGPLGTRLVYVSGHDGDLAGIGGLLGLHWTADGNTDATPPDSQIVFQLWQSHSSGKDTIRILYRAQTLDQLRDAARLTSANPPAEVLLTPPGCNSPVNCSFSAFHKVAVRRLDLKYVRATLTQTRVVP